VVTGTVGAGAGQRYALLGTLLHAVSPAYGRAFHVKLTAALAPLASDAAGGGDTRSH
jgi:hypothetical protein